MATRRDGGDGLSVEAFRRLYEGGLALDDEQRRRRACYVLLLAGRFALTPQELVHCRASWIDWDRGTITVPAHEPCSCGECWVAARRRQDRGDDRPLDAIVADEQWAPPATSAPRTVAFGWSPRTAAALAAFFDGEETLSLSRPGLLELVQDAAAAAPDVDADAVSLPGLRHTAVEFLAAAGFGPATLRQVTGWDAAPEYARTAGRHLTRRLYEQFGRGEAAPPVAVDDPASGFPVVCGTAPYDGEPFDVDADSARGQPTTARSPTASTSRGDPAGEDAAELHAELDEDNRGVASATPGSGGEGGEAGDGGGPQIDNSVGPRAVPGNERSDDAGDRETETETAAPTLDPKTRLTEPVRTDFTARVSTTGGVIDGPTRGRVLVGQETLLLTATQSTPEAGERRVVTSVALSSIFDVAVDYVPSHVEDRFEDAFSVAYEVDGTQRIAVVEPDPKDTREAAQTLYAAVLDGKRAMVTHFARVGGRVLDEPARPMTIRIEPERLRFSADDDAFAIDLSEVVHVETGRRQLGERTLRALLVRYRAEEGPVTVYVGTPSKRLLALLHRYVELEYGQKKADVGELSLSAGEKEILVALYTTAGGIEVSTILDKDSDAVASHLDSLREAGLIETSGGGTALTETGRIVVSERLDDVNT
ncbi:MAG: CheF family chemotaxis protein [Haloarculaceae archaeon]